MEGHACRPELEGAASLQLPPGALQQFCHPEPRFRASKEYHISVIPECLYRESSTPRVRESEVAATAATPNFRHSELVSESRSLSLTFHKGAKERKN